MNLKKPAISAIIILVSLVTIIGLSGLNFIITDTSKIEPRQNPGIQSSGIKSMDKIILTTEDDVKIAADLYSVNKPRFWLVLIHMMPETKDSYKEFAKRFQNLDFESIAIDLRGHGQSDGGSDSYRNFSNEEHQKSILDLKATVDYLIKNRGATKDKIVFIGASIGANLSLQYISDNLEFKTAILLSTGLDYHGIKTESLVKNLKLGQKIFFISSKDDKNNAEENQTLYDLIPDGLEKKIKIYENAGHGTDILKNESDLFNLIIEFIKQYD
ncbi:alpha/beta fold hydrolase [Candidatus Wolfebacteria bacterium]|nr:alpha/beta fold hydrolase [Candidatus Wolfebacteria bacterium]